MKIKLLDCAVRLSEFAASIALAASYLARSINDDLHVATHNAVVDKHDKLVDKAVSFRNAINEELTKAEAAHALRRKAIMTGYDIADDAVSDANFARRNAINASAAVHL